MSTISFLNIYRSRKQGVAAALELFLRLLSSRQPLPRVLGVCLVVGLTGCSVTVYQTNLFHPSRLSLPPPDSLSALGVAVKNISIPVEATVTLRGLFLRSPTATRSMIYFYGNGESVWKVRDRLVSFVQKLNVSVLAIDYRGYGFSDGEPTLQALAHDAESVADFQRDSLGFADGSVFVYGRSIGAGPALVIAAKHALAGVILEAPPTSVAEVIPGWSRLLPWYQRIFVSVRPSDDIKDFHPQPIELIPQIRSPLLVLHGSDDDLIPIEIGRRLFNAAGSVKKEFIEVKGANHNTIHIEDPPLLDTLQHFINVN